MPSLANETIDESVRPSAHRGIEDGLGPIVLGVVQHVEAAGEFEATRLDVLAYKRLVDPMQRLGGGGAGSGDCGVVDERENATRLCLLYTSDAADE